MTLIIAVRAQNGIVMASDSRAAEAQGRFTATVEKIIPLPDQSMLVSGSGPGSVVVDAIERLRVSPPMGSIKIAKREVKRTLVDTLRQYVESVQQTTGKPPQHRMRFLVAGRFGTEFAIMLVDQMGEVAIDVGPGVPDVLAAIGGPDVVAHTLARPFLAPTRNMDLEAAKLLAYRIMADSITYCGIHLGWPVDLRYVTDRGALGQSDDAEVARYEAICAEWRARETRTWQEIAAALH